MLYINFKKKYATLVIMILLSVCILFRSSQIATFVALGVYFFYFIAILYNDIKFIIKYFAFVFGATAEIIGCTVCEFSTDLYLNEIDIDAHFVGAIPALIFIHMCFFIYIRAFDNKLSREIFEEVENRKEYTSKWVQIACLVTLAIYVLLFLRVANKPSLLMGLDRFDYIINGYLSGIWLKISNISQYLVVIPIMAISIGKRKLGVITLIPYIFFLIWTGNKFGAYFNIFCVCLLAFYKEAIMISTMKLRKIIFWFIVFMGLLIGFSVFAISFTNSATISTYFYNRVAQQGQLWWRTYELCEDKSYPEEFHNEIDAIGNGLENTSDNVGSRYGIYNIMYFTAPESKIDYKLATNSRYTSAGLASGYYYFGIWGSVLFALLIGYIVVLITCGAVKAIYKRKFVLAILLFRLWMAVRVAYTMFLFHDLYDTTSLLSYAYLFLLIFIGNRSGKRSEKYIELNRIGS